MMVLRKTMTRLRDLFQPPRAPCRPPASDGYLDNFMAILPLLPLERLFYSHLFVECFEHLYPHIFHSFHLIDDLYV